MNYQHIPLDQIVVPVHSIKIDNHEKFESLKKSVESRGQIQPINVREIKNGSYELITGRKLHQCLKELGIEKAYCANHGRIDEHEAKLIYLEIGLQEYETDQVGQAAVIEEVVKCFGKQKVLKKLPMKPHELNGYLIHLHHDWEAESMQTKNKKTKAEVTPAMRPELDVQGLLTGIFNV